MVGNCQTEIPYIHMSLGRIYLNFSVVNLSAIAFHFFALCMALGCLRSFLPRLGNRGDSPQKQHLEHWTLTCRLRWWRNKQELKNMKEEHDEIPPFIYTHLFGSDQASKQPIQQKRWGMCHMVVLKYILRGKCCQIVFNPSAMASRK